MLARLTHRPCVVFTTANAQHAVTAFELGAVDYLLKPFGTDPLAATMQRVRATLCEPAASHSFDRISEVFGTGPLRQFFVRIGSAIMPVPVMSIAWFEADGDYVTAHTERGRRLLTVALNRLEARLDPTRLVRIHRTEIVNLDAVVAFRRHGKVGMTAELRGGMQLASVGPRRRSCGSGGCRATISQLLALPFRSVGRCRFAGAHAHTTTPATLDRSAVNRSGNRR